MKASFNKSHSDVLLMQPLESQWVDPIGNPLPAPLKTERPVQVVVDLMEETHVQLDVPSMMLNDRRGFVDFNLQSKLPDVQTRTTWPNAALNSPLPKAFTLNAVGVASERLRTSLDQLAAEGRPLVGAWTLSYLLAYWASRRKDIPRRGALFLCLSLRYGMRVVLLQNGVPVFSRLLLSTDAGALGEDLLQTVSYLVDSRVLDRGVPPPFVLLDAAPGLSTALFSRGLSVLPVSEQFRDGVLGQVLGLAKSGSPGQIATVFQRRLLLASQLKRLVLVLCALGGVGLAMTAYGEVQRIVDQFIQANQWTEQTNALTRRSQQLRQKIADSGADVALMRLTSEVQSTELPDPIDPTALLWQLGQLMQAHASVTLVKLAFAGATAPCTTQFSLNNPGQQRGAAASSGGTKSKDQIEWKFELRPGSDLSPRARQDVLVNVGKSVANWSEWQVVNDPVRPAGTIALSSQVAGDAGTWAWCLRSNALTTAVGNSAPGAAVVVPRPAS